AAGDVGGVLAVAAGQELDDRARLAKRAGAEHEGLVLEFHGRQCRGLRAGVSRPDRHSWSLWVPDPGRARSGMTRLGRPTWTSTSARSPTRPGPACARSAWRRWSQPRTLALRATAGSWWPTRRPSRSRSCAGRRAAGGRWTRTPATRAG